MKRPRIVNMRIFRCPGCGAVQYAAKLRHMTPPGHIKHMWCPWCKAVMPHEQIGGEKWKL